MRAASSARTEAVCNWAQDPAGPAQIGDRIALRLTYIGERVSTYQARPGLLALRIYSVPSTARSAAVAELVEALPAACKWIASIPGRPEAWRSENHAWTYELGGRTTESALADRDW
jgi:hypothetical protein